jgi:hypothetical protein
VSVLLSGCERVEAPDASLGVSWSLASHRASTLSNVSYRIYLTIPDSTSERIRGRETLAFDLSDATQPLVIDFKQPRASVSSVGVGAADIGFEIVNDHIVIPAAALQVGRNEVEIEFLAGDGSLNRNREFLYTLFVPDRARFAFPCFDQPNLKARFNLTLEVPASWQAVANGRQIEHDVSGGRAVFAFAETKAISTYLFSFAAGDFQVVRGARGGREMRIYEEHERYLRPACNSARLAGGLYGDPVSVREVRLRSHPVLPVRRDGAPGCDTLPGVQSLPRRISHAERHAAAGQSHRARDLAYVVRRPCHDGLVQRCLDERGLCQLHGG